MLYTFEELKKENKNFNHFDYISFYSNQKMITSDLFISFFHFFWPEFILIEDMIFIKEKFRQEYFEELKKNESDPSKIEIWMNIISLDSYFLNAKYSNEFFPQLSYLSNEIIKLWKIKLSIDYPEKKFIVESDINDENDEIFILLYQPTGRK